MRYHPLPVTFYSSKRKALRLAMEKNSVAIIDTLDLLTRGDFEYPFHPDPNFFYLTGIDEPEAVLVMAPDHPDDRFKEVLFTSGTYGHIGRWEGERLTPAQATQLSGIQTVFPLSDLEPILDRLFARYETIYLNSTESVTSNQSSPSLRRAQSLRAKLPLHQFKSAVKILGDLRTVKDNAEVQQIEQAVSVTEAGLKAAISHLQPGRSEYEIEAVLTAEYLSRGAEGNGFSPVVAAGANGTIIHYFKNDAVIKDGDLVQFDTGAEVGFYTADISRSVPAGSNFSPRQRAVYDAVYRTHKAAIALHRPGASVFSVNEQIQEMLLSELVGLKVITSDEAKGKDAHSHLAEYYPHISHHLGLDTHDTGSAREVFKPGMVVTCEPGLYLAKEGIGVRLEDDLLITESDPAVLSSGIPTDPDELIAFMKDNRP
jgi:Xaa-Pro aminopeptidase